MTLAPPTTDPGFGNQTPTLFRAPESASFNTFDAQDCVEFAARFDLVLDPWQEDLTSLWMRRDDITGKWLAGTWGISVPRQNGKNGTLEAVEMYMMVVLKLRILHTAQEVKTAQKHFRRMKHFFGEKKADPNAKFPALNRLVKTVRSANGQEAIFLWNPDTKEDLGSIEISARSKSSARGFTNDVLVLDEAQHLKDEHLEALRPAISAAPSGDPVAIYMGTPPKTDALLEEGDGAAFLRIRMRAVESVVSERTAWMEFGLDVELDRMSDEEVLRLVNDRDNWRRVNPALGRRLFVQTIVDELTEMGPRSFARERLNVWPSRAAISSESFPLDEWDGCLIKTPSPDLTLVSVGLDMDLVGRLWLCVAASAPGDETAPIHVELLPDDILAPGTQNAVNWLWERCRKRHPIVMPADSGATLLEAPLRAKGMKVYRLNVPETVQASSGFVKAVFDGDVTHLDDPVISKSISESGRETLSNGLWRFARGGDMSGAPLGAVSCARFGAVKWASRRRTGKAHFG